MRWAAMWCRIGDAMAQCDRLTRIVCMSNARRLWRVTQGRDARCKILRLGHVACAIGTCHVCMRVRGCDAVGCEACVVYAVGVMCANNDMRV